MNITYRLITRETGHTLEVGPYAPRAAAHHARFIWKLWRTGMKVRIDVTDTAAQRSWAWVKRTSRWVWDRRDPRYTVSAYSAYRYCADQIEGGRWFDAYTLEDSVKVWRKRDRIYFEQEYLGAYPHTGKRYSVLGGEDYTVMVTPRFGFTPSYIDTYVPYS